MMLHCGMLSTAAMGPITSAIFTLLRQFSRSSSMTHKASSAIGSNMDFEDDGISTSHHHFDADVRGKIDARNVCGYCMADGDVTSDVSGRTIDDATDDNIADNDVRGSYVTPATIDVGVQAEEQPPPPPGGDTRRPGVASDDGASAVYVLLTRRCDCCTLINMNNYDIYNFKRFYQYYRRVRKSTPEAC